MAKSTKKYPIEASSKTPQKITQQTTELTDTTTSYAGAQSGMYSIGHRIEHRALFDSTLQEMFLRQGVQLREPIAESRLHTVVYSAIYKNQPVAVKILTLAEDVLQDAVTTYGAFKVECEKTMILSRRTKSVLEVIDYGDVQISANAPAEIKSFFPLGMIPFMITELAPFGSLDKVMHNASRLPGFSRLTLLSALATATDGIKEAHEHKVAHRDIKPQNILIFSPRRGKIADFGIARWRSAYHKMELVELTPKYCSPEQAYFAINGQRENFIGHRGDIYSWAIMAYELLTGVHPFSWALKKNKNPRENQKRILKAIAKNDRRGFKPMGDITFDSLIHGCTKKLDDRIDDIAVANRILKEFTERSVPH